MHNIIKIKDICVNSRVPIQQKEKLTGTLQMLKQKSIIL